LGNEKRTRQEELSPDQGIYNFTTSGSYIKLGLDYNTYANWYGEQNSIYIGGRYAFSTFSQTLNNFQFFDRNRYWNPDGFVEGSNEAREISNLTASWLEFVFGIKVELLANIYIGSSIRLGFLISEKEKTYIFLGLTKLLTEVILEWVIMYRCLILYLYTKRPKSLSNLK